METVIDREQLLEQRVGRLEGKVDEGFEQLDARFGRVETDVRELRGDVKAQGRELRGEIGVQGVALRGEIAEVRGSISALKLELLVGVVVILAAILAK